MAIGVIPSLVATNPSCAISLVSSLCARAHGAGLHPIKHLADYLLVPWPIPSSLARMAMETARYRWLDRDPLLRVASLLL